MTIIDVLRFLIDTLRPEHKLAEWSKNEDGTMTAKCSRGCVTVLQIHPHPGDHTKTLGDRVWVTSIDCSYWRQFKKRHTDPLPRAVVR